MFSHQPEAASGDFFKQPAPALRDGGRKSERRSRKYVQ